MERSINPRQKRSPAERAKPQNRFLASLGPWDRRRLEEFLEPFVLKRGDVLTYEGKLTEHVFFPVDAVVSLNASVEEGKTISTALIGNDGIVGAAPACDGRVSLVRAEVPIPGLVLRTEAKTFKAAVLSSPSLLSAVFRHEQTLFAQTHQIAACMSLHNISQQLTRTLLRMHDLLGDAALPLTHTQLSEVLGARRTSVTQAAVKLQNKRLIENSRGKIEIRDAAMLRQTSCDCYASIRQHYGALLKIKHEE